MGPTRGTQVTVRSARRSDSQGVPRVAHTTGLICAYGAGRARRRFMRPSTAGPTCVEPDPRFGWVSIEYGDQDGRPELGVSDHVRDVGSRVVRAFLQGFWGDGQSVVGTRRRSRVRPLTGRRARRRGSLQGLSSTRAKSGQVGLDIRGYIPGRSRIRRLAAAGMTQHLAFLVPPVGTEVLTGLGKIGYIELVVAVWRQGRA